MLIDHTNIDTNTISERYIHGAFKAGAHSAHACPFLRQSDTPSDADASDFYQHITNPHKPERTVP